jgi:hypothetical protein
MSHPDNERMFPIEQGGEEDPSMTTIMEQRRSDARLDQMFGQITKEAAQGRPYWQAEPCPLWCDIAHEDSDPPPDRTHLSKWAAEVVMSLADWTDDAANPGGGIPKYLEPPTVQVHLAQGWRETEPHVVVGPEVGYSRWNLTLAEARQLADELTTAVGLARSDD